MVPSGKRMVGPALFLLIFFSYAFFATGTGNVNTISRLAWVVTFVERGHVDIDYFAAATVDKSKYDGHYFSDKAPGLGFLALPIAYVFTRFAPIMVPDGQWTEHDEVSNRFKTLAYACALFTSSLFTAVAALAMFRLVLRRTGESGAAVFTTLCYALGTPTWGWATSFFGHSTAGAALFLGFAVLDREPSRWRTVWGGVLLGMAISVEFTAAPAVALIALHRLVIWWREFGARPAVAWAGLVSVAIVLSEVPLLIYNDAAFASPFRLGYGEVEQFEHMHTGFFGISAPNLTVLGEIIFGPYRGLLRLAPVLLLVPVAAVACARLAYWRGVALLAIAVGAYYLLMNSGYYYWDGNWSIGPRHVTAMLPFLCLILAPLWQRGGSALRGVYGALLAASIAIELMCAAVQMNAPVETVKDELFDYVFPQFLAGHLTAVAKRMFALHGMASLLPLLALWLGLISLIAFGLWSSRKSEAVKHPR